MHTYGEIPDSSATKQFIPIMRHIYRIFPNPAMTLGLRLPDLKNKRVYSDEKFEWIYPTTGKRITLADLDMGVEEVLNGILTDIDQDFPIDQTFTRSHIISTGIGTTTKFWDQPRKNP